MNLSRSNPILRIVFVTARVLRVSAAGLGKMTGSIFGELQYFAADLGTAVMMGAQPRQWKRTVRKVFAEQLLQFGVKSVRFVLILAVSVGDSIVVELEVWTGVVGQ